MSMLRTGFYDVGAASASAIWPALGSAGSAAAPTYSFSGDPNTGVYNVGADQLGISTGGTLRTTWSTTAVTHTLPVLLSDGTSAAPAIGFASDADGTGTGFYRWGANIIGVSCNGTNSATFSGNGFLVLSSQYMGWYTSTNMRADTDSTLLLRNSTGTDFNRIMFGGTTSSFPALKRNGATLDCRLADDSGEANIHAATLYAGSPGLRRSGFGNGMSMSSGHAVSWNSAANLESGATDTRLRRVAASVLGLDDGTTGKLAAFSFFEDSTSDIAAGSTGEARVYARDNGAGKTQLCVRFATGTVQVLATEP